jgi:hypothetical protein
MSRFPLEPRYLPIGVIDSFNRLNVAVRAVGEHG